MLFVVDTNTLISAFILPNSISAKALDKTIDSGILVQSQSTAKEFAEVFARPKFEKYLQLDIRLQIIRNFHVLALIVNPTITISASRDKKDGQFLELAVFAKANCTISGDKDLLVLNPFDGIQILSARDFLDFPTKIRQS